jgi:Tfp pilus assembly protein PilN
MRPLNLIPLEDRRGENAPLRTGILSYVIVGALVLVLVGVVAYVTTSNGINENKTTLAELETRQAEATQAAAGLSPYSEFASLSQARMATVQSLARSRFDWERVLQELALVIPADVTIQTLSAGATSSEEAAAGATDASGLTGPSMAITGCAKGQEAVAEFLAALKDIDGVTRVGMQSSALGSSDDSGSAPAPTSGGSGSTGCPTGSEVASFQVTVAFDAVPAAATATTPDAATAAATTPAAPPTTAAPTASSSAPSTDTTTASDDSGISATEAEQNANAASANSQVRRAQNAAGVSK